MAKGRVQVESVTGKWRWESSLATKLLPESSQRLEIYEMRKFEVMLGPSVLGGWSHSQGNSNLLLSPCSCSFCS